MNLIYGLIDPRTRLIRYVGLSSTGMRRPRRHRTRTGGATHRATWLRELARAGFEYEIAILETVDHRDELPDAERWWIAFGRALGWPLTNGTAGGDGSFGPSGATRDRMRLAHLGKKHTPETRDKMRDAIRAARSTEASKAKTSAASVKLWADPAHREKIVAAMQARPVPDRVREAARTREWTPEMRAKLSASKIGHEVSAATREKISRARRRTV